MILYTAENGIYINYAASLAANPHKKMNVYINLTNKCQCSCTFCLRNTKKLSEENALWIKKEPSAAEVIAELDKYDWDNFNEIVFCGFGEPTLALETLLEVAAHIKKKKPSQKIRINSNGLANLSFGRDITPSFRGLIDTISISLNASTAEEYLRLTRNKFGIESYKAMLDFAVKCKAHIQNVVLTVVDCIGETEIEACRKVAASAAVPLRVRAFEE
jgi:TatD family-associated radical SAM protein